MERPRILKCSIKLTLGATTTGRQTDEMAFCSMGLDTAMVQTIPQRSDPPGLENYASSLSSLAGKPALELGLCGHRSTVSQESRWTQEVLKLDVSRHKYNLGHRPTQGIRHHQQPSGHCGWGWLMLAGKNEIGQDQEQTFLARSDQRNKSLSQRQSR